MVEPIVVETVDFYQSRCSHGLFYFDRCLSCESDRSFRMGNGTEGTDEGKPLPAHLRKPTDAEIENRFRYHPPKTNSRIAKHAAVSELTENLAKELRDICPPSRGLSLALTAIEEARMWANQALACDSPDEN